MSDHGQPNDNDSTETWDSSVVFRGNIQITFKVIMPSMHGNHHYICKKIIGCSKKEEFVMFFFIPMLFTAPKT